MPVYLHLANLVFDKKTIEKKYQGGCDQFRIDWDIQNNENDQEDDELFLIAAMNIQDFNIDHLTSKGLEFDGNLGFSNDFVGITRYGGLTWEANWLKENSTFAWHINCKNDQMQKAIDIGENMTVDKFQELAEKGIDVFETIKS